MKEKRHKSHKKAKRNRSPSSSNSSSASSEEWVEKHTTENKKAERDDWMAMTGMLKTFTKNDIRPTKEDNDKKHIDSYNPSTSTRELNPYWKDGGSGLPQTAESFRQSRQFLKPSDDDNYYTNLCLKKCNRDDRSKHYIKLDEDDCHKPSTSRSNCRIEDKIRHLKKSPETEDNFRKSSDRSSRLQKSREFIKPSEEDSYYRKSSSRYSERQSKKNDSNNDSSRNDSQKSYNWKKDDRNCEKMSADSCSINSSQETSVLYQQPISSQSEKPQKSLYLSDEKMNKLAAKIVKAEIMGDMKLVDELKEKLEAAREYRKQNPDAEPDKKDERVMLIATNSAGNSRPLTNSSKGDARSKGGKRKADTHMSGERAKYFGNDDKYNLAEMFQNEKYGNNYNDEAELARIASKSKNPNDDLEDIFLDEISKNRNETKDNNAERDRAIKQHVKMEKSLEGCEYCLESKNMLKHLIVSCSDNVYVALPSRKSLVKDHCQIATILHSTCVTSLDEDVWAEIMDYRKALTQFFNSQDMDVVFFETATRLHRFPHMVINCVPLPRDVGDMASIYFKKALLECELEWSMNKKVVDLKGKNIRKGVPKGLPYFWIDFGMDPGFAHVIEDQQLFPKTFAEQVIAGILDLDHSHWKNTRKETGDAQRRKVIEFTKEWKAFDPRKTRNRIL